jgi:hypothetical protein
MVMALPPFDGEAARAQGWVAVVTASRFQPQTLFAESLLLDGAHSASPRSSIVEESFIGRSAEDALQATPRSAQRPSHQAVSVDAKAAINASLMTAAVTNLLPIVASAPA